MLRKIQYIILLSLVLGTLNAQTGGDNTYEFLNLTHSGFIASLGGTNVSIYNDNPNLTYDNPALLNRSMGKSLALNYVNYFADINYGCALYSGSYSSAGNFSGGLIYLNYGSFTEADAAGIITGSFRASEYALLLSYSREINSSFSAGIAFKPILSHLEKYTSLGFAFDIGASYHNQSDLFSAGIVLKNVGLQLITYTGGNRQKLPFEILAGLSQKLPHAPLRFSLTLNHLEKYDLTSDYEDSDPGNNYFQSSAFLENMLRHVTVSAELIPYKNIYISAGYNYRRRKELQVESKISTVGLSWGFGVNTTILNLEFGRATYHLAGASTHISLTIKPDQLYSRFKK
ncbi:MAG: type IX secretion system protein PorQ [Bacteroidetes bacterium]|jgi:hypothetical protein|nr:type IX secretion system protein PorQ [Bacteroidota bacterium]